jgi:hypothetical protein
MDDLIRKGLAYLQSFTIETGEGLNRSAERHRTSRTYYTLHKPLNDISRVVGSRND